MRKPLKPRSAKTPTLPIHPQRLIQNENVERIALKKRDDEYVRTGYWEPVRTHEYDEY